LSDEHVFRLEVAMHDAGRMRGRESATGCDELRPDLLPVVPGLAQPCAQRLAFDQLHGNEKVGACDPGVIDRRDVGMRQLGHRSRFAHQARRALVRIVVRSDAHQLDRELAPELRIVRLVDRAHATCAEGGKDDVPADLLADPHDVAGIALKRQFSRARILVRDVVEPRPAGSTWSGFERGRYQQRDELAAPRAVVRVRVHFGAPQHGQPARHEVGCGVLVDAALRFAR
jgi:hypothetical protein